MVLVHHASPSAGCDLASLLDLSSPGFIAEDSFLVGTSVLSSQNREGDPSFAPAQVDLPHWEEEGGYNSNPVPWWALSLEGQSHPIWGGAGPISVIPTGLNLFLRTPSMAGVSC